MEHGPEHELDLVRQYLDEHFDPIRRLVSHRIQDPDQRMLALRRCTRHIFHWARDHGRDQDPFEPFESLAHPERNGDSGLPGSAGPGQGDGLPAEQRPPEEWVTGDDPATPRQLGVLRDHGVGVPDGCTKAQASRLITEHVYSGQEPAGTAPS